MGQKRLEKAISSFGTRQNAPEINVDWKPYIIDPNNRIEGKGVEERWGSKDSGWIRHLKQEGRKDGAMFKKWDWWPHTMKGHLLVKFAQEKYGVETSRSNSVLFNALYEEGKNVSLTDVLVQIGKDDLGLPEDDLIDYLESGEGIAEVKQEIGRGRRKYDISGVPFFVIGQDGGESRPYGLSGAQSHQTFLQIFEELSES